MKRAWLVTAALLGCAGDDPRGGSASPAVDPPRVAAAPQLGASPWPTPAAWATAQLGGGSPVRVPVDDDGLARLAIEVPRGWRVEVAGQSAGAERDAHHERFTAAVPLPPAAQRTQGLQLVGGAPVPTYQARSQVTTVGPDEVTSTWPLVVEIGLDAALAAVARGPQPLGDASPSAQGVIDLLDDAARYQGPAGPFSQARYVALARPVVADPSCPPVALDIVVHDRFTGRIAGMQRFGAAEACRPVAATVVRTWLAATFVR